MIDFDLLSVIKKLSTERVVFHSEADFQFALAWAIKQKYNDAKVRLEYGMLCNNQHIHIDIVVFMDDKMIPIELKYKTVNKTKAKSVDGESYSLKNHGAQDNGRYDFIKDINRIETILKENGNSDCGYSIMLTNDHLYWDKPRGSKETISDKFRIHNGAIITKERKWVHNPSKGTIKGRESAIDLKGEYNMFWNKYYESDEFGEFRFIIVETDKQKIPALKSNGDRNG